MCDTDQLVSSYNLRLLRSIDGRGRNMSSTKAGA